MSDAESIDRLRRIGWRGDALPESGLRVARVVAQHRAGYELHDGEALFGAQPDGRFLKRGIDPTSRPVVGDFVEVEAGTPPHIMHVAPRRTVLSRAVAGERYEQQIIASNIDYVFVLTGLDGDFNPARIERYLSLIEGSGAQPVILLSKLDTRTMRPNKLTRARTLARGYADHRAERQGPGQRGAAAPYLQLGDSAVLVGSSGAGKST